MWNTSYVPNLILHILHKVIQIFFFLFKGYLITYIEKKDLIDSMKWVHWIFF